ncbi:MAG: CehA/McbA family metallohydrolase [Promethearchaeota archaeon]
MSEIFSWFIGFVIWFFIICLIAFFTYLISDDRIYKLKGNIPDFVFNYTRKSDILPQEGFFLDMHSHTIASDGWMTPEQNIKWHIANGFNAFAVTDHNSSKNNIPSLNLQEKYKEIVIIPGFEWTTSRIHLNFLGIKEYPYKVPSNPTDDDIIFAIKEAKKLGAVVQVDHITWTMDQPRLRSGELKHPTREQLIEWGVDGFEINNEMRWYDPKTLHWLEKMKNEGKLNRNIFISTGTDIHNPIKEWATCWTEVLLTDEEKKNPDWSVIKKALLEGRTRIWVDHDYVQPYESKFLKLNENKIKKTVFAPFYALAYGVGAIPGGFKGILSYILWFLLAYFPLRLLFQFLLQL